MSTSATRPSLVPRSALTDLSPRAEDVAAQVAVARGAAILPYAWKDARAADFARTQNAVLAGPRTRAGYSLSPASFLDAPSGLRCVLPSPNGAMATLKVAATRSMVLTGCLRNASAVADAARRLSATFNVCPAGERWPDGTLRPALEDWLAAGAILRLLPGAKSPEPDAAISVFERGTSDIATQLARSSSGRELIEQGFARDVELAAQLDASSESPRFDGVAYRAIAP